MAAAKKTKKETKVDQSRPFLGLQSFEEKNKSQFGGRDQEIRSLFRLVEDHNLTLVYGTSGIGKTSIIKAGLMPELRKNFYYPVYIRIDFSSSKAPWDQLRDHVYQNLNRLDSSVEKMTQETIWEYLHEIKLLNGLVMPVLIFDQFEEIFTLGKDKKGIRKLVVELGHLAQNRIPATVKSRYAGLKKTVPAKFNKLNFRVVISLREDYLPRLDELKNYIPSITDNSFRVVQMSISQAMEAAIKPGKGLLDEKVAQDIIKKLPGISQADFDLLEEKGKQKDKLKVEPFLLSLICQRLNERRIKKGLNYITSELVKDYEVDDSIRSFYDETLGGMRPEVDVAIQELLLDADGFRKLDPLKEFQEEHSITDEEVDQLVNARIIRREIRNNVVYLELSHDVLAPVIRKKRSARKRKDKEAAKDEEVRARTKKTKRILLIVLFSGVLIGVFIGLYVWRNLLEKQQNIWVFVTTSNTENGFRTFRENFPNSSYDALAVQKLDSILHVKDFRNWKAAIESNSAEGYQFYLKNSETEMNGLSENDQIEFQDYFQGLQNHRSVAQDSIEKIEYRNNKVGIAEKKAWDNATSEDEFISYLEYIKSGYEENFGTAVEKLKSKGVTGWIFAGKTNGSKVVDPIFKFESKRDKETFGLNDLPVNGDIVRLRSSSESAYWTYPLLQLYNDSKFKSRAYNRKYVLENNQSAMVLQTINDGTSLFLKLVFE